MDRDGDVSAQLEPLRSALIADARKEADAILEDARLRAQQIAQRTDAECKAIELRAREEGVRAGTVEAARRRAEIVREQRRRVLRARCEAHDRIRGEAIEAVLELRRETGYRAFEERLEAIARRTLGEDALVERDPEGTGGVRATHGSRSIDLSLPRLADVCFAAMNDEIAEVLS